jgi:hypothetical protein
MPTWGALVWLFLGGEVVLLGCILWPGSPNGMRENIFVGTMIAMLLSIPAIVWAAG